MELNRLLFHGRNHGIKVDMGEEGKELLFLGNMWEPIRFNS
jgi:hypothetical protein